MNQLVIAIVVFAAIVLIIFLVRRNQKDKKALMQKLNNDYAPQKVNEPEI